MKAKQFILIIGILFILGALPAVTQAAPLTITLNPSSSLLVPLTAYVGSQITFTGNLSNSGSTQILLNGFQFSTGSPTEFINPVFSINPASINIGESLAFSFSATLGNAPGLFSGSISNRNVTGTTPVAFSSAQFYLQTSPAPEPATMTLFGSGLVSLGVAALRRRRNNKRNVLTE